MITKEVSLEWCIAFTQAISCLPRSQNRLLWFYRRISCPISKQMPPFSNFQSVLVSIISSLSLSLKTLVLLDTIALLLFYFSLSFFPLILSFAHTHRGDQPCARGWWGYPTCGPCNCDVSKGFKRDCNKTTGECSCKVSCKWSHAPDSQGKPLDFSRPAVTLHINWTMWLLLY